MHGHGPSGQKVAHYICDLLPAKISLLHEQSSVRDANDEEISQFLSPFFSTWKTGLIKSFEEMDEELEADATIESYCSGSTSVTVLKMVPNTQVHVQLYNILTFISFILHSAIQCPLLNVL